MTFDTHQEIIQKYLAKIDLNSVDEINNQNSFQIINMLIFFEY